MLNGFAIFIFLIVLLLISWSLVTFWQRFLENLFYQTWNFNPDSTVSTFVAAILATALFLLIVWLIKFMGLIPNVDMLIFDYQDDTNLGGALNKISVYKRPRQGGTTIGGKTSPRGALFA